MSRSVNLRASRVIQIALIALGTGLIRVPTAAACSCAELSFEDERARSQAIFEGRVDAERVEGETRIVTLRVTQAWRGVEHETVEVRTARDSAACGFPFAEGAHYLVYAARTGDALSVSRCSRTGLMDERSDDRQRLGSGTIPVDVDDTPAPVTARPPTHAGAASCATSSGSGTRSGLGLASVALAGLALVARRRALRLDRVGRRSGGGR